jgi:hypothetical protein
VTAVGTEGACVSGAAPTTTSTVAVPGATAVAVIATSPIVNVFPCVSVASVKPPDDPGVASSRSDCTRLLPATS